jgi:hypothetical protein
MTEGMAGCARELRRQGTHIVTQHPPSFSPPWTSRAGQVVVNNQLKRRSRSPCLLSGWLGLVFGASWMLMTAVSLSPDLEKGRGGRKSFYRPEVWAVHMVILFVWREKQQRLHYILLYWSMIVTEKLWCVTHLISLGFWFYFVKIKLCSVGEVLLCFVPDLVPGLIWLV